MAIAQSVVTVSVKDLDVFSLMADVIQAADAFVQVEHVGPPKPCRVIEGGCTCGVADKRNELRAEFYRRRRILHDRLERSR